MNSEEEKKKPSNLYRYLKTHTNNVKDSRVTLEQMIQDKGGDTGLYIKLFKRKKSGDKDNILKVTIKQLENNKFGVRVKKNDTEDEKELDMTKLKKFLGENKDMAYALNYINKEMDTFRKKLNSMSGGSNCGTKHSKKKGSRRKGSRRKGSRRKGSKRKGSRKKGSKKRSRRKGSKKKGSRKGSRRKGSRRKGSRKKGSRRKGSRKNH